MEDTENLSFEAALQRLEEIVAKLDGGELSLEEAIAYFQAGNRLREYCEQKLKEAASQVEELLPEASPETANEITGGLFGDD